MSIRFSVSAAASESIDQGVVIDAHHIASDDTWFEHPIRSHVLAIGASLHLLAHVALGFVLHRGERKELCLCFTHDDPGASHWLEIVVVKAPGADSGALPGAILLADHGEEAIEVERVIVPPGGSASVTLYLGTHLQIREVLHFRERDGG